VETAGDEKKGVLHRVINVIHTENEMSDFSCMFFGACILRKGKKRADLHKNGEKI